MNKDSARFVQLNHLFSYFWELGAESLTYNVGQGLVTARFKTSSQSVYIADPQLINGYLDDEMLQGILRRAKSRPLDLDIFSELLARCGIRELTYTFHSEKMTMVCMNPKIRISTNMFNPLRGIDL